jgi:hypothetical protein
VATCERLGIDALERPVRFLGGRIVRRAVMHKERREAGGERPNAISTALAKLAPAGLES